MAGNENSGRRDGRGQLRDKPFRDALRIVEKELADGNVHRYPKGSLRWNAQQLLMRGTEQSIREVGDRLDGKPAQETDSTVTHTYEKIVREIVYPENQDSAGIPTAH